LLFFLFCSILSPLPSFFLSRYINKPSIQAHQLFSFISSQTFTQLTIIPALFDFVFCLSFLA
jgi:hypothetical protein